jgi:phosphinothricin acetyltransferase
MITLRVATPEDGPALSGIYSPYVTGTVISFEARPPDAAAMAARIEKILPTYPWLIAEIDGAVVGYAYASPHAERAAYRWSVDVGVYIAAPFHRMGVGRSLYRSLLALLTAQRFETAYGRITLPNASSVALHESLGFRLLGVHPRAGYKMGAWRDIGWWGCPLGGAGDPPAEPVPFAELTAQPGWRHLLAVP